MLPHSFLPVSFLVYFLPKVMMGWGGEEIVKTQNIILYALLLFLD